jgi:hypothetical protein
LIVSSGFHRIATFLEMAAMKFIALVVASIAVAA